MSLSRWILDRLRELDVGDVSDLGNPPEKPVRPCPDSKRCVCPTCGYEMEVEAGKRCNEIKCPKCGDMMMRPNENLKGEK